MYRGTIIEESLRDKSVLDDISIVKTEVEEVTAGFNTPWLKQWTLDVVEIADGEIDAFVSRLQDAIETEHTSWYADLKNDTDHYIIFPQRVFHVARSQKAQYHDVVVYGVSLGIPKHQLTPLLSDAP